MKYATVVTAASDIGTPIPGVYFISPADGENPAQGQIGAYARIKFANPAHEGCSEVDVIGVLMHQLAAKAQDGEHRHFERALQCLDSALKHLSETLEVVEDHSLSRLVTERVA